ncbi:DUF397 domain-containing protein [Streptomyces sp. WMMC1477]|uniref:DUF397 domain-containing protein n=1 Tax=Streptomyces sp. WMMC1477 TaxID=3015155 RepID=UPI002FC295A0
MRDNKRPHGPAPAFGAAGWSAFVAGLTAGTLPTLRHEQSETAGHRPVMQRLCGAR